MEPKVMAARLVERGHTQSEVAQMVEARGIKCNPSQISRLLSGQCGVSWQVGDAIRRVYMDIIEKQETEA